MNRPHPFELATPIGTTDHILGESHARLHLVEFGDFECPNCKQAAPAVKLLLERNPGRICFAFRHFPLEEVHPHALLAAEVSEVAAAQDRFWPMHDLLFDNNLHLKGANLRSYAERLQLDMARYQAELDDHIYLQRVREHMQIAHRSGVRGTPAFFLNGHLVDVSFGIHVLHDAIEAALHH